MVDHHPSLTIGAEMDSFTATAARMPAMRDAIAHHPERYRVVTGERPTGRLHLGHYFGTIRERVRLQTAGVQTFIVLADYQVITDRDTAQNVHENVHEAILDYLAAGLDPRSTTIFTHSAVPALTPLMLPFLSLITDAELRRNPTVKAELSAAGRALSGLLLTYPVHQAADILSCQGNLVPVGKDNLPHIEVARTLSRRFNERYGEVFPEPAALITDSPELPGLDGRKMSKSYGNAIALGMTADETAGVITRARTDSERAITYEPQRRPGVAGLLTTAAVVLDRTPEEVAAEVGVAGAGALKRLTIEAVNEFMREHRIRRAALTADDVENVLSTGNARAQSIADVTLDEVRTAMGMQYARTARHPAPHCSTVSFASHRQALQPRT
jgi:tryptophanyl-tRNA synthetase